MVKHERVKIYFAGSKQGNEELIIKLRQPRLYSFHNEYNPILDLAAVKDRGPMLIDSGAFSVARGGEVNVDEYIKFINDHPEIENFIQLDVIPYPILNLETAKQSAEQSWKNYLYMIERLDDPYKLLPVFHFGEHIEYFKRMLEYKINGEKHIPFICIGGRHGVSTKKQEYYFNTIFETIHSSSNKNVKIHALGMTVLSTLQKFPFYSCDSTTHLIIARYGSIYTKYGVVNISSGNNKKCNYKYFTDKHKRKIKKYVEDKGYVLNELITDEVKRIFFNIQYFVDWQNTYEYKGKTDFSKSERLF